MQQLSHFELVGEFHDVFGHPQRKELYYNVYNENPELVSFRIDLIEEEYKELLEFLALDNIYQIKYHNKEVTNHFDFYFKNLNVIKKDHYYVYEYK